MIEASNGMTINSKPLETLTHADPWLVLVSSSWTPERHLSRQLQTTLQKWERAGINICGLDTGAIILANAGLLNNRTATVHYEHIDAFMEIAPTTQVSESMFVRDGRICTCCGGTASTDLGLQFVHMVAGESIANATARYLFHHDVRGEDRSQTPKQLSPWAMSHPAQCVQRSI